MGAKQLEETATKFSKKSKNHRLIEVDFDNNPEARRNLISIIKENARNLEAFEVAYYLNRSLSDVYANVPRVNSGNGPVRFDPLVVEAIKTGGQGSLARSVKFEEIEKSSGLSKVRVKRRKEKIPLCL